MRADMESAPTGNLLRNTLMPRLGNTIPNDRTYYKTGSSTKTATHVGMISGEDSSLDQLDLSTLDFIVSLIDGSIDNYTSTQLSSLFGISQRGE